MNSRKTLKSLAMTAGLTFLPASALAHDVTCDYLDAPEILALENQEEEQSRLRGIKQTFEEDTFNCIKFDSSRYGNQCIGSTFVIFSREDVKRYSGTIIEDEENRKTVEWTKIVDQNLSESQNSTVTCTYTP